MPETTGGLSRLIKTKSTALGFDHCGFSAAGFLEEDQNHLDAWLEKGFHGGMNYMSTSRDIRPDAEKKLPGAKSVISFLLNYYHPEMPHKGGIRISKYGYGNDYHRVIKKKLAAMVDYIHSLAPDSENLACVDTAAVFEKKRAQKAGLGWIGKNCILINKDSGSFHFIGSILTTLELDYDQEAKDACGDCHKCLDACPTGALTSARTLDARKCIAYLTNSYKGEFGPETPADFSGYIFGCDLCQDACPWNRFARPASEPEFSIRKEIIEKSAEEWEKLSEAEFLRLTENSGLAKPGLEGIKRNIRKNKHG